MIYQTNTIFFIVLLAVKSYFASGSSAKKKIGYFNSSITTSSKTILAPYTANILNNSRYSTVDGSVYSILTLPVSIFTSVPLSTNTHIPVNNSAFEITSTTLALSSVAAPELNFETLIQPSSSINSFSNNTLHLNMGLFSTISEAPSSNILATSYTAVPDIIDETITVDTTKIKTITSCSKNLCATKKIYTFDAKTDSSTTFVSTYFLSTSHKTVENTITEYTTWCPLIGSSNNKQKTVSILVLSKADSLRVSSVSLPFLHEPSNIISQSSDVSETNELVFSSSVKTVSLLRSTIAFTSIPTTKLSSVIKSGDYQNSPTLKSSLVTSSIPSNFLTNTSTIVLSTVATTLLRSSVGLTKIAPLLKTVDTTEIFTITSCSNDKCDTNHYYTVEHTDKLDTFVSTYVLSTTTLTDKNVVTEYTTWCPFSASSSVFHLTSSTLSLSSEKQKKTTSSFTTTSVTTDDSLYFTSLFESCSTCTTSTISNATNLVPTSVTSFNNYSQSSAETSSLQKPQTKVTSVEYSVYTTTENGFVTQYTTHCPYSSTGTDSDEALSSSAGTSSKMSTFESSGTTTTTFLTIVTTTKPPDTQSSVETISGSIAAKLGVSPLAFNNVDSEITTSAPMQISQDFSSENAYPSSLFTFLSSTLYSYSTIEPTAKEDFSTSLAMPTQRLSFSSLSSTPALESITTENSNGGSLTRQKSVLVVIFGLIFNVCFI